MPKAQQQKKIELPPIEMVAIGDIKPYHRNARRNDKAVPAVKESIERYGMNQPLVVDSKGVIVVGHTRYRALMELGVKEVPVVRPKLTAKQVREYRIADNKTGEIAEWDRDPLIAELRAMDDAGAVMAPFFSRETDLARLLEDSAGRGVQQTPVDAERMDNVIDRHQGRMADIGKRPAESKIRLECPHCGEEFLLDRSTVESHAGDRS